MRLYFHRLYVILAATWFFILLGVFAGIPALAQESEASSTLIREEPEAKEVEDALTRVMIHANSKFFLQRVLEQLSSTLLQKPVSREAGTRILNQIRRRFPGLLFFTILDSTGNVVPQWCDGIPPRAVLRRLHGVMRDFDQGNTDPLVKSWKILRSFFGTDAAIGKVIREKLFQVSFRQEKTWLYLSREFPNGTLICHINRVETWKTLGLRHAIARWNARKKNVQLGLANLKTRTVDFLPIAPERRNEFWDVLAELERFPLPVIARHGHWWGHRIAHPNLRLVARRPLGKAHTGTFPALHWILAAVLVPLLLLVHRFRRHLFDGARNLPIAWKLNIVYLSVTGLSLLILSFGGQHFLRERRDYLENRRFQSLERALQVFDRRFPIIIAEAEKALNKLFRQTVPDGQAGREYIQSFLTRLAKRFQASRLCILEKNGDITTPKGVSMGLSGVERLQTGKKPMVSFIRLLNNPDPAEVVRLREDISHVPLGKASVDDIIATIKESFHSFRVTDLGPDGVYFHAAFPLYTQNHQCAGIVFLDFSDDQMQTAYIRKYLPRFSRQLGGAEVFAFHLQDASRRFFIAPSRKNRMIPFHLRVSGSTSTLREIRHHDSRPSIMLGTPGKNLSRFSLMVRDSVDDIARQIQGIRRRLIAYGLGLLLVSLIISHLLARHFLLPVQGLNQGIHALENRIFAHRVPVENPDEFGNLAVVFNGMMEDMADLEVAKVVQETLFPTQQVVLGGIRIFGRCMAASQVGGDYFDYRPQGTQRLLFFIGDVSGHGISAAIIMAMAKGVFDFSEFAGGPKAGMDELNQVLTGSAKRKKMMTALLGSIDTETGEVDIANAGHINPLVIRNDQAEFLTSWGKPLGVSRHFSANSIRLTLEPGDTLVLMTDGFPEALDLQGTQIGYDRLREAILEMRDPDLMRFDQRLRQWHQTLSGRETPEDDVSLLLISRQPAPAPAPAGPEVAHG